MSDLYTEVGLNEAMQEASEEGRELNDFEARAACSAWHGGQGSAFYAFSSSGHFDRDLLSIELSHIIAHSYATASDADKLTLDMLGTFFINRDPDNRPWTVGVHDEARTLATFPTKDEAMAYLMTLDETDRLAGRFYVEPVGAEES